MMSKRQFLLTYGMNLCSFNHLVALGVIQTQVKLGVRSSIFVVGHNMLEGEHYVICSACGAHLSQVTTKHLKVCSGTNLRDYQKTYTQARILSRVCQRHKAKTNLQKRTQSECLLVRFETPEGTVTRQKISEASKRLQSGPYREKASEHLRRLNNDPKQRFKLSSAAKGRWADPEFRAKIQDWQKDNRVAVLERVARARQHVTRELSSPHRLIKSNLGLLGLSFQSELPCGPYHIDEADPVLKVAVEIDGCYWHGCLNCKMPPQKGMAALDKRKTSYLVNHGWVVIRLAECAIHSDLGGCLQRVLEEVSNVRSSTKA